MNQSQKTQSPHKGIQLQSTPTKIKLPRSLPFAACPALRTSLMVERFCGWNMFPTISDASRVLHEHQEKIRRILGGFSDQPNLAFFGKIDMPFIRKNSKAELFSAPFAVFRESHEEHLRLLEDLARPPWAGLGGSVSPFQNRAQSHWLSFTEGRSPSTGGLIGRIVTSPHLERSIGFPIQNRDHNIFSGDLIHFRASTGHQYLVEDRIVKEVLPGDAAACPENFELFVQVLDLMKNDRARLKRLLDRSESVSDCPEEGWSYKVPQITEEGGVVTIRYLGWESTQIKSKGLSYIQCLVENEGTVFLALELQALVNGHQISEVPQIKVFTDDSRWRQDFETQLDELNEKIEEAEEFNDLGRISVLKQERAELLDLLPSDLGKKRILSRDNPELEKARKAVCKAINEALIRLGESKPELEEFFRNRLTFGFNISYNGQKMTH